MEVISFIAIVWAALNIILFFKLWGACNNIKRIADKYDPEGLEERKNTANKHKGLSPFASKEELGKWLNENK